MSLTKITYILITLVLSFVVLQRLESLIIPFLFSVIIWLIIRKVRRWFLEYFTSAPKWLATSFSSLFVLLFIFYSLRIIGGQVQEMLAEETIASYTVSMQSLGDSLVGYVDQELITEFQNRLSELDFMGQIQSLLGALSGVLGNFFMVLLYLLFLILEENLFRVKLKAMYPNSENHSRVRDLIQEITKAVESYISLKTIVSLITAAASYLALIIIGVDFALFWAILIFILNYIPAIGSLIATLFPAVIAFIQYEQFQKFALVLIVIGAIQLIVGNIVEPKVMGDNLNISPLVVILSLTFWGMIWGVVGMVLSVPIMVIIIIVMSKIPATRNIALLLSGTGKMGSET